MDSYSVVEFVEDLSIAVVSSSWLDDTKTICRWPTTVGPKLSKFVITHKSPEDNWASYPCIVKKVAGKVNYLAGVIVILMKKYILKIYLQMISFKPGHYVRT